MNLYENQSWYNQRTGSGRSPHDEEELDDYGYPIDSPEEDEEEEEQEPDEDDDDLEYVRL